MAFSAKFGTLQTGTGTTDIVSGSLGFTPKAVILWCAKVGATHPFGLSFGAFTAATERACASIYGRNGVTTTDTARIIRDDAVVMTFATTGTVDGLLDAVSLDADTITVIPDDAFGADEVVHFLALGGDDLTNAKAGTFTLGGTVTTQDVTGVGFTPDCVLIFGSGTVANTIATGGFLAIGVGVSATERGSIGGGTQDNVADTASRSIVTSDLVFPRVGQAGTDVLSAEVDYNGGITDGFQLDITVTDGSTPVVGYLALKGPQFKLVETAMVVGTTDQVVTGVGFTPKALFIMAHPPATASEASTPAAHLEMAIGAATGTGAGDQGYMWIADEDALASSDNFSKQATGRAIGDKDKETGGTDEGDMILTAFGADGFTLDQDTAAGQATFLLALAMGDAAAGGAVGQSTSNRTTRRRRR